mgnify:CR=1 FL=1
MNLWDAAEAIVHEQRNAGHGQMEVWAALHYVDETGSVNGAVRALQEVRDGGAPPRWLIVRWACHADLSVQKHSQP